MNPELKEKWVKALRSGEYKQRDAFFERNGKFCCLGVLCKVGGAPTLILEGGNWPFVEEHLDGGYKTADRLATMNDDGATFPEIADYIEQNL